VFARGALKKLHDPVADVAGATRTAVEALYDAADDDSATGGPDLIRRIYPVVVSITAEGAVRHPDDDVAEVTAAVVNARTVRPGG
jgi:proteasome beta subunit